MESDIKTATAYLRDWATSIKGAEELTAGPATDGLQAVVDYLDDAEKLNDALRGVITPAATPKGDDTMSVMIRSVLDADPRPDIKDALDAVRTWMASDGVEAPVEAILVLAGEAERIADHRATMAAHSFRIVGGAMATMTDGSRHHVTGEATTQLGHVLSPMQPPAGMGGFE